MNCHYFETTFLIKNIDAPKVFEYFSSCLCRKVICRGEVNLAAQFDKEWYIIYEKYISIVRNTSFLNFKNSLGTLMRSSVTRVGFFVFVFPFRYGTSFPQINLALSTCLVSTGQP